MEMRPPHQPTENAETPTDKGLNTSSIHLLIISQIVFSPVNNNSRI